MVDRCAAVENTGKINLALFVDPAADITALHVPLHCLLFPYIITDLFVDAVFFKNESLFQSFRFFCLDWNKAVTKSDIPFRLFHLDHTHQGKSFFQYFEFFRIEGTYAVYFAFSSKVIHTFCIVQPGPGFFLRIIACSQGYGCQCDTYYRLLHVVYLNRSVCKDIFFIFAVSMSEINKANVYRTGRYFKSYIGKTVPHNFRGCRRIRC